MSLEGDLAVRLAWDGRRVRWVDIESTRPFVAGRLMAGRGGAEAAAMLPRLYSICAHAQGAAASGAVAAASGRPPSPEVLADRSIVVVLETLQEYLWRLLIDWPRAMDHAPVVSVIAAIRKSLAPVLARLSGDIDSVPELPEGLPGELVSLAEVHVYGEPLAAWQARSSAADFDGWVALGRTLPAVLEHELLAQAPELGRSSTMLMPAATAAELRAAVLPALDADLAYARAPMWNGMTVETGALARTRDHPIVAELCARDGYTVATRMAARVVELGLLLGQLRDAGRPDFDANSQWVQAFTVRDGEGLAAVQTARGLLLHRARMASGLVTDYRIVAPTEWNFHPAGPLVQGLEGTEATDAAGLERSARLAIQALDPCVACRVEVARA
jgi:Ni,Fe-hydrogenase I large subunit